MCGITGVWWPSAVQSANARAVVMRMAAAIHHRGPDAGDAHIEADVGLALGHRRLSILDLSLSGAQPMISHSGRYVIVFNGEIYNHLELRLSLERTVKSAWRGHADTETLLAAIDAWGLSKTLEHSCGMFALALWDRATRRLTLARDRLGEKPLYYGWSRGALLFGSELKALTAFPGFDNNINQAAVASFLRFSYVPDPTSIFNKVFKLPPGCLITFDTPRDQFEPVPYWSLKAVVHEGSMSRLGDNYDTLVDRVETCLSDVVASQMLSDVPLGCFLSGGIDSSLTAALMTKVTNRPVRTFSIGFDDARFNEAPHARHVAEHLGTCHTEFIATESDALAVIPDLPAIYDEPFADPSQIPTILLSRMTREHVTVALSGDGGDEMFGGYNRYIFAPRLWRWVEALPRFGRRLLGYGAKSLQSFGTSEGSLLRPAAQRLGLPVTTIDKLSRFGDALGRADNFESLYQHLVSTCSTPLALLRSPKVEPEKAHQLETGLKQNKADWMMAMDAMTYLPGDILVKVDRAAMSASLETRTPFLDRRVVELAWQLPQCAKIQHGVGKRILRDVLYRHVPRGIIDRPKQGFSVPLDRWLRGELREWASELLSPQSLAKTDVFDQKAIGKLWQTHLDGRDNAGLQLWSILMLQLWKEKLNNDNNDILSMNRQVSA